MADDYLSLTSSSLSIEASRHTKPFSAKSFMSISPTDAQETLPSSSRAPLHNSFSTNGLLQSQHSDSVVDADSNDRSVQIPASESEAGLSPRNSGAMAAAASNISRSQSSKKMNGMGAGNSKKDSKGQMHGSPSHSQMAGRGGLSSQIGSDQSKPAHISGKQCGSTGASFDERAHSASGSITMHSTPRKNQMVNANHLLNFHYDPISRPQSRLLPPRKPKKIQPYNKDLFLQANFKFVVLDSGNQITESKDPDKMLQWEDVVCVRYSTPLPVQCPICLESPLCPQITSCGHIFCFPCILRYLLMADDSKGESWRKCPLCFTMISAKDLYTIYIDQVKHYSIGDEVQFTLLTRARDSLVPSQKDENSSEVICHSFSKFILTSDVELSISEAQLELHDWLVKADSGLVEDLEQLPYVCAAVEQLEQRKKYWTEHQALTSMPSKNHVYPSKACKGESNVSAGDASYARAEAINSEVFGPQGGRSAFGDKDESQSLDVTSLKTLVGEESALSPNYVLETSVGSEVLSVGDMKSSQKHSNGDKDVKDLYTFYQAIDGQHIILHPLNMNCLLHHYRNPDLLPSRINGKILQLEALSLSETVRKRFRFLSHFSLTTTLQLCEIDMSNILPPDALAPFMDDIKKRQNQRKRLAKKENKEKVRAEATAMNAVPIPPSVSHSNNSAIFSIDDFEALGSPPVSSTSPPVVGERKLFSSVTRLGFAAAHDSPSLRAEESSETSRSMEATAEATAATGPRGPNILSFANIISTSKAPSTPDAAIAHGFGKKGKKPNKILLSTAGGRRY